MMNGIQQGTAKVCLALSVGAFTLAPAPVLAALEGTTAPTIAGGTAKAVHDPTTGLVWLTPQATLGMSYAAVVATGYSALAYRFATSGELVGLLGAAGFDVAPLGLAPSTGYTSANSLDVDSLRMLIGLLGNTTGHADPIPGNAYSNLLIYGILAGTSPVDGFLYGGSHYMATLDATGPAVRVSIPGTSFPTSDGNVGSFLVRDVTAVSEPSAVGLFAAGLVGLFGTARVRCSRRQK